ncbi:DNA helicase [Tilletia horrida]|nr:DNA helicase [Tilletia horrida]
MPGLGSTSALRIKMTALVASTSRKLSKTDGAAPSHYLLTKIVCFGDFFQLPPVTDSRRSTPTPYAFETDAWCKTFHTSLQLKGVYRQQDTEYQQMLKQVRIGSITDETLAYIKTLSRALPDDAERALVQL